MTISNHKIILFNFTHVKKFVVICKTWPMKDKPLKPIENCTKATTFKFK